MTESSSRLHDEYASAFQAYLGGDGEAALQRAYDLGRRAIDGGLGVLDITAIYQEILAEMLHRTKAKDIATLASAAATFFAESLSPFEMTHRSFREANAALRASEERYRGLLENANDIVFTANLQGIFTSINRAGEEITGYPRDELCGMSFRRLFAPEFVERAERMLSRKIRSGGPTLYEAEIITKDGRRVTLDLSTRLIYQEGQPIGVQGIARDITERMRAARIFRDLLEAAPDGMVVFDRQRRMVIFNAQAEKLFGYAREELLGKEVEVLVPERFRERHAELCAVFFAEPRVRPMGTGLALVGLRKGGDEFPAEISLSPLEAEGGTLVLAAIRDVTEQKRAEEAIQRMNEALEEQAKRIANALHDESGQLLASVHIALGELAGDMSPEARKGLQNVKQLLDQIEEQLRQFSHELRPTILDDLGLVPALEFLAQSVSRRTGLLVGVECARGVRVPPPVEVVIYRVVQAALTNVARHAQAKHVSVKLLREGDLLRCWIKDDGVGFDVSGVLGRRGERGLGLTGIRDRLDALGGTFGVHSRPGHGTELRVTIPLEKQDATPNHSG